MRSMRRLGIALLMAFWVVLRGAVAADEPKPPATPDQTGVKTRINPRDGAEMVFVPAGEFLMGSPEGQGEVDEHPQKKVYLSAYWMYKTEVTVAQYRQFCQATGRQMPGRPEWNRDDHPVVNVNWDDADAYAKWAGVALPTEAQWEKAARGTDGRQYPWGNDWASDKCVNSVNSGGGTKPVGSLPAGASPYGALDMAGNVWEWCADWWDPSWYAKMPDRDPCNKAPVLGRVNRGGSWYGGTTDLRAAGRGRVVRDYRSGGDGFRCAEAAVSAP